MFMRGRPGHFARVCQSNTGYKPAPSKAVVSVSSVEKTYLAGALSGSYLGGLGRFRKFRGLQNLPEIALSY